MVMRYTYFVVVAKLYLCQAFDTSTVCTYVVLWYYSLLAEIRTHHLFDKESHLLHNFYELCDIYKLYEMSESQYFRRCSKWKVIYYPFLYNFLMKFRWLTKSWSCWPLAERVRRTWPPWRTYISGWSHLLNLRLNKKRWPARYEENKDVFLCYREGWTTLHFSFP